MSTKDYVGELRALIGTRPVNFVGAAGLLRSAAGEVLLVRRVGGAHWGLPAGISELGEALPDTLRRELREETGLEVESAELIEVLSPDRLSRVDNGDEFYSYTALYRVTRWSGEPVADGSEIAEARFFAPGHLPAPLSRLGRRAAELLSPAG